MADDIVIYLREWVAGGYEGAGLMENAADEIERLQAEVNLWMGAAERFAESDPKFEAYLFYFRARNRAVRNGV